MQSVSECNCVPNRIVSLSLCLFECPICTMNCSCTEGGSLISPLISGRVIYHSIISSWLVLIKLCCCFLLQLSSSVWSPQSIEFSLQQFCLPFLRLSCLLQHHLYGDNLPGCPVGFIMKLVRSQISNEIQCSLHKWLRLFIVYFML